MITLLALYLRRRLRRHHAISPASTAEKGPAFIEPFITWTSRARHRNTIPEDEQTTTSSLTQSEERRHAHGRARGHRSGTRRSRRDGHAHPGQYVSSTLSGRTGETSSGLAGWTTTTTVTVPHSGVEDVRRQMADMRAEMDALRMLHLGRREEGVGDDEPPPEYEEEG